ncbi:cryptochrome/deoxyribodipyrimidine photo-lyase family protein [Aquimarina rhabdastrellae]
MYNKKEHIVIVWFKRDLRLEDNEAISNAIASGKRILLLYVFEELLLNDTHYSKRHWDFIKQSIVAINTKLQSYNTQVLAVQSDMISVMNKLQELFFIDTVYSHQETGILITYQRDKKFNRYCKNNKIKWIENINNGVQRGIQNRLDWGIQWEDYMKTNTYKFNPQKENFISNEVIENINKHFKTVSLHTILKTPFQKGGRQMALRYKASFFEERYQNYASDISKPQGSRTGCSRLSPYFAWGNLSIREVWQEAKALRKVSPKKRTLDGFMARLRWQAHFIQKFEMEYVMEKASVNKGFHKLKKKISQEFQEAWKTGNTGVPIVDACMRCLNTTGYLNFRMRAMVVSFFTHLLWQPWQEATIHLSRQFLDFEPGIHFPQLQMQAGETGINTLRIYNPIKNGLEHDPDAAFIKAWVPELASLDTRFIHEPYLMTSLEQGLYNFRLGEAYPYPIIDMKLNRKRASDTLWKLRTDKLVIEESKRILLRHTLMNRKTRSS